MEVYAVKPNRRLGDHRTTVSDARDAYFAGDFERCLALCEASPAVDEATRFEFALLRARVLVRLDRAERAVEVLRACAFTPLSVDQHVSAQMLLGAAYVRLGQVERGAALLHDTMESAAGAHATIRAELALNLGVAWFRLGDFEAAERLLRTVPNDADIIHARALEYTAWIAQARGDHAAAADGFRATLGALDVAAHRDRYVEANALYGLAMLAPEMLLVTDWTMLEPRLRRFDWSVSGVRRLRFWTSIAASMMLEVRGDIAGARAAARAAEVAAEDDGHQVVALCRLGGVFRGAGEPQAHVEFVERARAAYDALNLRDLPADLLLTPLHLAEELAYAKRTDDAAALLVQHREIIAPALRLPQREAARCEAMERSIEAMLHEARGDHNRAVHDYKAAFRVFAADGYRLQATQLALRLARLTGNPRYERYAAEALRDAGEQFWMVRELAELRGSGDPALTRTESEILALVVHGRSYKEIAAARGVSWKTVGNHVQALFRKFSVRSRGELAAEALRRRMVSVGARRAAGS